MSTVTERLEALERTRELAARTLAEVLREVLASDQPLSEVGLRDRWLERLRAAGSVYEDGWYTPPPHGMTALFSTDADTRRASLTTLRDEEAWPRDDVWFNRDSGLMMLYASPVDRKTGVIGDFGLALYFGHNAAMQKHLAASLQLTYDVYDAIEARMTFEEIETVAARLMRERKVTNDIVSVTDPAGTDIGHTIPAVKTGWTAAERSVFERGRWSEIKDMISHKRRFVSGREQIQAREAGAFTIEPQARATEHPELPAVWYHTVVEITDVGKRLLTGFGELFEVAGMDYMPRR